MSNLTTEIRDPRSPVALWLREHFPHHVLFQREFREAAGHARQLPAPGVAASTQGTAIDWWIRLLADPSPSLGLALSGVAAAQRHGLPSVQTGLRLLAGLGAVRMTDGQAEPVAMDPARFADRSEEWWARVCYALALLVEPLRAYSVEGSRLNRLTPDSPVRELLALATADEVADLIGMRELARERLLPGLPGGEIFSGPTFDGSFDLRADADLIAGGLLLDIKASQGGKPRKDGTRAASLGRDDLDQLLGYTLMDYTDRYRLHSVGVYATRFGHLAVWPLDTFLAGLAGRPVDLAVARASFARVLREDLPAHWQASHAAA
ncbi:hypothetical protein [Longispora albida]|uniref:hypothetical protein n=1 Tax=Longispora albida TaxID=203523 RepID=UPI00058D0E95|nr:hypothetical protein [Longispora albida]